MAFVPGAGQALGRDRPLLGPGRGLEDVEEREAHRLLELRVALQPDVRAVPEVVQIGPLLGDEPLPTRVPGRGQRGLDLVPQRRDGPLLRPAVGQELDHPQARSGVEHRRQGHAPEVLAAVRRRLDPRGPVDEVVHSRGDTEPAGRGDVDQAHPLLVVTEVLRAQR